MPRGKRPRSRAASPTPTDQPKVISLVDGLTRQTVEDLAADIEATDADRPVVIDLAAIRFFDSDGTDRLGALEVEFGQRVSIVGLRQATARLMELPGSHPAATAADTDMLPITRLHSTAVLRGRAGRPVQADALQRSLDDAFADDVAIVVVDFRDAPDLQPGAVDVLTFASSRAALGGRELLIVNVSATAAQRLRDAGLSATTYLAPTPDLS